MNKILLVAHSYPSERLGGVELYTHRLAKELKANGLNVSVFYPRENNQKNNPEILQEQYEGIRTYVLERDKLSEFIFNQCSSSMENCFEKFLNKHNFDLVHFQHTINMPASFITVAKKLGLKVVLTIHDFWFMYPRPHLYDYPNQKMIEEPMSIDYALNDLFAKKITNASENEKENFRHAIKLRQDAMKQVLSYPDLITVPSNFVLERYKKEGLLNNKAKVLNPGIECLERAAVSKEKGLLVIGYIGSINELKNIYRFVDAFKKVDGEIELHIWGSAVGQHKVNVEQMLKSDNRIKYCGEYSLDRLGEILSSFDLAVVPSVMESYCFTVREALSMNVPVLASNVGGIPEVVKDRTNGLLFNPLDLDDIEKCIRTVLDDKELLVTLNNNLTEVRRIDLDAREWKVIYQKLCESSSSASQYNLAGIDLNEDIKLNPQLKEDIERIKTYLEKKRYKMAERIIKEKFQNSAKINDLLSLLK